MKRFIAVLAASALTLGVANATAAAPSVPRPSERVAERTKALLGARMTAGPAAQRASANARSAAPATRHNFRLLGHLNLPGPSAHADVFFYDHGGAVGKHAYVGTWGAACSARGVKIIDVNNPRRPRLVALPTTGPGESREDIVVQRIGNRDVMGVGVQICGEQGGPGGLALFDVTQPMRPRPLSFLPMPAGGVHEMDMVVRPDGRALALLAVPFVEFENTYFGAEAGGEFRLVDITDPRNPVELADWGIIADSSLRLFAGNDEISSSFQGLGYFAAHYAHSARAADQGMTAYVSYWDGGVLKFDISDPTNPVLLARTTYPLNADGDAHSMTPYDYRGRRYILQNDEDGTPFSPVLVRSSVTGNRRYQGIDELWMPTLLSVVGPVSGRVHDAGDGCQAADYRGAAGRLALADTVDPFYVDIIEGWTVPCDIGRQVRLAARAGARAFVSNLIGPDDPYLFGPADEDPLPEGMPAVQIADIDDLADKIRTALGRGRRVTMTLQPTRPAFGFLRVYREGQGRPDRSGVPHLAQVGKFTGLPYVTGTLEAPPGTWTIHNTEVNGRRAYSSWNSHGVVALDLTTPERPRRVGQFVPPASGAFEDIFGPPTAEVWGVAIDYETDVVYASDMRSGLWIVKPTGRARP